MSTLKRRRARRGVLGGDEEEGGDNRPALLEGVGEFGEMGEKKGEVVGEERVRDGAGSPTMPKEILTKENAKRGISRGLDNLRDLETSWKLRVGCRGGMRGGSLR